MGRFETSLSGVSYAFDYYNGIFYNGGMSMATEQFPAEHVQPLRNVLGLTQTEFAEKLGVSQPLVARWESGDRLPSGPAAILLKDLEKRNLKKLRNRS